MMTSRERVRKAIEYQKTDRVPIDIGGTKVTGIHADEYAELIRYVGLDLEPVKVYEQWQMLARVDELMMRWLGSDVIQLENLTETWGLENTEWKIWNTNQSNRVLVPGSYNPIKDDKGYLHLLDGNRKSVAIMSPEGLYYDRNCSTEMSTGDIVHSDPEFWKNSIPLYTDRELMILEKRAKFLFEYTDYSIHGGFLKGGLGTSGIFAGHTICDWLCILASEEDYAYTILSATADRVIENLKSYLQAVGKYIDTILISGTDFGTQKGELFNPEIFKKLHFPNYRKINNYVHNNSSVKTMYHSCGSIYNIIEYFIEAGADILNPVHTNTLNMEPQRLVNKFAGRIVFWGGGIETQTILPFGSTEEVREQVKNRLEIFGQKGGYVFSPVHNIQHGVPPENIRAMIDTVLEHR
jgi:uroporphyrinogen decarboxylase